MFYLPAGRKTFLVDVRVVEPRGRDAAASVQERREEAFPWVAAMEADEDAGEVDEDEEEDEE